MTSAALEILTDLAREARDKAGQLLASDRRNQHQIEQQQELLLNYRAEYAQQLQDLMMAGIDPVTLQNYRQFLMSLDDSILQASRALHQQTQKVKQSQNQWQQEQKKLSSFTTLNDRRAAAERVKENRKEQRLNDEFASQRHGRSTGLSLVKPENKD
ncbi:flagellar export protein FliJ [Aliidiomarina haloalkalitolerans]|uniref:Flagellar FliJ protein n=1 Tax=Aliidiomarina haloalkalitolerans TaxID=859059 RepID=A0A432VSA0_9GAMM|nr:flagellar export protein FliJ [Aliidiomarina haloalkalitolerans]MCL4410831.1 flagellar export protein FliJ [Gammaproteobacteria bacterium]RUO19235.1 flagellar export protein FliJ [Aliidiomarina haloalkalitolerans]